MRKIPFSGDHTTSLWQLRESHFEYIRSFEGHSRSVKTVAFRRTDPTCFATGGRDNAILIWDTRAKQNPGRHTKADNRINSGHATGPGTPQAFRRKATRQTPKLPPNTSSSSITGLAFQVTPDSGVYFLSNIMDDAQISTLKQQFLLKKTIVLFCPLSK